MNGLRKRESHRAHPYPLLQVLLFIESTFAQPAMSKAASAINGLSVTELVDGVKVYNLTSGKSLPNFLTDRQKRKLRKTDEYRGRVELIQDFEFPTASSCIQTSPSGQYIVSAGVYPPMIKIFETDNLSMKCERYVDAEVVRLRVLEDSYRKLALLRQDRTIELHAAYGKCDA